ncbi:MAG: UDP-N-acetylglucosamine 1-carboxyvinyltransferase [Trueperaceae bacterium]
MDEALIIHGGKPLTGEIPVYTAKNSALYLILATLLTPQKVVLKDIPKLRDVVNILEMLEHFGAEVFWQGRDLHIHAEHILTCSAPYQLVSRMRASFVAIGALVGRCGDAKMSMPGGCAFGPRPVDRHIKAFRALGAEVLEQDGDFIVRREKPLEGRVVFEAPTVGGTQNILLASAMGEGTVIIENAALEPEIPDLANMLNEMGANITGAGTSTIIVQGVPYLKGITYRPIPDRIEAGTFMLAIAATRGKAKLLGVESAHMSATMDKLQEAGVRFQEDGTTLIVDATSALKPVDMVALEYPGIATDLQAPFGAFLSTVEGVSYVEDHVYPDRFTHLEELKHTGANFELVERTLNIQGRQLRGAKMQAADIRAGGALIVAALAAKGTSVITGLQFIDRGYENIAGRLRGLGADIHRSEVALVSTGTYGD